MIYFLTYGDDKYTLSKQRLFQEALNFKIFDDIKIYGRNDIGLDFIEKTKPYINMPVGGGYWLWKSFFLKNTFEKMKDNDYCVYIDAGCSINPYGQDTFNKWLRLLDNNDTGTISFYIGTKEENYNTDAVFEHFQIPIESDIRKSDQIIGGILIFRKCEKSQKLIDDYYNLAISNPKLFSDENNLSSKNFSNHRHDQSVFSVMRKLYGSILLKDESYTESMDEWYDIIYNRKIPFLATRIRN